MNAEEFKALAEHIAQSTKGAVIAHDVVNGELELRTTRDKLIQLLLFLRDDGKCLFKQLVEISGLDFPERPERFDVAYFLLSLRHNSRVRVKVATDEKTAVPSVTALFSSAGWFEREAWDMYGILFAQHPDLRRILTDYGFDGHPLRRDFPLTGYVEVRYDVEQKRVVYEPVKLNQAYRSFDYLSPWEGPQYAAPAAPLPGDEKATK